MKRSSGTACREPSRVLIMPMLSLAFVFGSLRTGGAGGRLMIGVVIGLGVLSRLARCWQTRRGVQPQPGPDAWFPPVVLLAGNRHRTDANTLAAQTFFASFRVSVHDFRAAEAIVPGQLVLVPKGPEKAEAGRQPRTTPTQKTECRRRCSCSGCFIHRLGPCKPPRLHTERTAPMRPEADKNSRKSRKRVPADTAGWCQFHRFAAMTGR